MKASLAVAVTLFALASACAQGTKQPAADRLYPGGRWQMEVSTDSPVGAGSLTLSIDPTTGLVGGSFDGSPLGGTITSAQFEDEVFIVLQRPGKSDITFEAAHFEIGGKWHLDGVVRQEGVAGKWRFVSTRLP